MIVCMYGRGKSDNYYSPCPELDILSSGTWQANFKIHVDDLNV